MIKIKGFNSFFGNKYIIIVSILLYRLLLDYFYSNEIMVPWAYFMICPSERNYITSLFSWLLIFYSLPYLLRHFKSGIFSSNVVVLLSFLSFIPTTTLLSFSANYMEFFILMSLYWVLFFYASDSRKKLKIPIVRLKSSIYFKVIILLTIVVVLYTSYVYTGFRFHFSFADVYDLRFEAREFDLPTIFNYIMASSALILPLSMVYFLSKKKYIYSILIFFLVLLNFGIGGHKAIIMMMIVSICGYYFYTFKRIKYLPIFFIFLVTTCLLIDTIGGLIGVRVLFIPSSIHYSYYEFFSVNEFDYWREGILSRFGAETPYKGGIMYLVGQHMSGSEELKMAANNGLFSDAYYNFGYVGVVVFPFMVSALLKLFDRLVVGIDERILFTGIVSIAMTLMSATFTTALLTGGLIYLMIFLQSIPKKNEANM